MTAITAARGLKESLSYRAGIIDHTMGIDEKAVAQSKAEISSSESSDPTAPSSDRDLDQAYYYLQNATATEEAGVNLKALRRKIDWRIVPVMFCAYTMQFIDKVLLNYAAVMGLNKDLKLKGNDFTNAATAFFIAYLIAEIPNGYALQVMPPAKWLSLNVTLWGICTACTAAATSYHTLLAARIFLGIFEAAIAPSLMLFSSQWYTKSEQAPRFSFWYCGLGVGQIIGGVVSYAFQQVQRESFEGWRIMFVVLGIVTVVVGIAVWIVLPDNPMKAKWLNEGEKVVLLRHVAFNQTGIENRRFKLAQVLEIFTDVQLWLLTLLTILISISSGVITTYSATLIRNFGFTPPVSALLNMPSGIVSIASALIVGYGVRLTSNRWAWIVACCVPGILGGGLMSFAPSNNRAALLAGIYLVNTITATLIAIYQWTAANVAGQTKRVVSVALVAGSFSVGNIIGPQTFQARDAPQYIPAKITVLATQAGAAVIAFGLFLYYVWANRQQSGRHETKDQSQQELWEDRTDKQNVSFRYVY